MTHVEVEYAANADVSQLARIKLNDEESQTVSFRRQDGSGVGFDVTFQARYLPLDDLKSTTRDWRSAPDANAILLKIAKLRNQLADLERVAKLLQTELKPDQPPSVQIQRDGITLFHDNQLDILKQGASIELGNGVHEFVEVPTDLDAKWYNRRGGYQGISS